MEELIEWLKDQVAMHEQLSDMNNDNVCGLTEKAKTSSFKEVLEKVKELSKPKESTGSPAAKPHKLLV